VPTPKHWFSVNYKGTEYRVNAPVIERIVHSYFVNYYLATTATEVPVRTSCRISQWVGAGVPDITTVEVDWMKVNETANSKTKSYMASLAGSVHQDPVAAARELSGLVDKSDGYKSDFAKKMKKAQMTNMQALGSIAERQSEVMFVLKGIQATSAGMLQIGATALPKPAAAIAMGALSVMRGIGTYSETGKIGVAVLAAGGELTISAFKFGKNFKGMEEVGMAFIEAGWAADMELANGKSVSEALAAGAPKLADPLIGKFVEKIPKAQLYKMTYSVTKKMVDIGIAVTSAKIVNEGLKTAIGKGVEAGAEALHKQLTESHEHHSIERPVCQIVTRSTISQQAILKASFVNMSKGIGKGW